jgi:DNA-binding transcriptional ArsR family regulator
MSSGKLEKMQQGATRASQVMKTLSHPGRLMILCNLAEGERTVGDLADELDMAQSSLSQHLMRMRSEGLVDARRESQSVFYRLVDNDARKLITALYRIFCP